MLLSEDIDIQLTCIEACGDGLPHSLAQGLTFIEFELDPKARMFNVI